MSNCYNCIPFVEKDRTKVSMLSRDIKDFTKSKIKVLKMKMAVPEMKKKHTDRLDSTESLPVASTHNEAFRRHTRTQF